MSSFTCIICNSALKHRNHKCGEKDKASHVQVISGSTSWGRAMPLKSNYNEL